jgi:hypothetical protein
MDTGFNLDLALPDHLARQLYGAPHDVLAVQLADGIRVSASLYNGEMAWGPPANKATLPLLVIGLPNADQANLGLRPLQGGHLHIDLVNDSVIHER